MIKFKCKQCNSVLSLSNDGGSVMCPHCGTEYVFKKKIKVRDEEELKYHKANFYEKEYNFREARELYISLFDYKDSEERKNYCTKMIPIEKLYQSAITFEQTQGIKDLTYGISKLESISGYRDSNQKLEHYKKLYDYFVKNSKLKTRKALITSLVSTGVFLFVAGIILILCAVL